MESAKLVTAFAAGGSSAVIIACLVVFSMLINDINMLHDEIMSDMDQFRVCCSITIQW